MDKVLNIPIEVIKRYSTSREQLELLALSIWIKCNYSNSVYHYPSYNQMRSQLGVSRAKAEKLITLSLDCELFIVNTKKSVVFAKSLKSKEVKTSKSGKFKYISDRCYKLEVRDNYKLREIVEELRKALIGQAIKDRQEAVSQADGSSCSTKTSVGIKYSELKKVLRVGYSSIKRAVDKMVSDGKIYKESVIEHLFSDVSVSDFLYRFPNSFIAKARFGYIGLSISSYQFVGDYLERFKHVIYTHKKRTSTFFTENNSGEFLADGFFGGTLSMFD